MPKSSAKQLAAASKHYHEKLKNDPAWRELNKQRCKEYRARKLAEDPDYFNRKSLAWQKANPEKVRAYRDRGKFATVEARRAYHQQYRDANRERIREISRRSQAKRTEYYRAYMRMIAETPEDRARQEMRRAVRRGQLVKPTACSDCGAEVGRRRIHGHHTDYSKPLDVVWLCATCHGKQHRK